MVIEAWWGLLKEEQISTISMSQGWFKKGLTLSCRYYLLVICFYFKKIFYARMIWLKVLQTLSQMIFLLHWKDWWICLWLGIFLLKNKYIRIKTISLILKRDLHFCPHNNKVQWKTKGPNRPSLLHQWKVSLHKQNRPSPPSLVNPVVK